MNKLKETLSIYGIQDKAESEYPIISHDHNLSVFFQGKLKMHLHQERISGRKYDNSFPNDIYRLLQNKKYLNPENFDLIFVDNVLGRSFINKQGNIRFEAPLVHQLATGVEKGKAFWLDKQVDAYIVNHELAHIYSCVPFYGNFKENSLLVHFDGGASLCNFSAWHFINGELRKIEESWDLEYLSSIYNSNALVFSIIGANIKDQNSVAGKFMGFASFGKYNAQIEEWLVNNQYFKNIWAKKKEFFEKANQDFGVDISGFNKKNQFLQDVASTLQNIFQRDLIQHISKVQRDLKAEYLYYSGGSALNIIVNTNLVNSKIFKEVFIPPCTNDSGLSLGAGAMLEIEKQNKVAIHSPYLNNWDIEDYIAKYTHDDIETVAKLLVEGKIVAVCNGIAEIGPRALGNRSILSLASTKEQAKVVSEDVKKREWYRPVAPIMLEKNVKFFTGKEQAHHLSKFMLLEFPILEDRAGEIEGVVHVDGTSRIQTIFNKEDNPFMYDLLSCLDENYNIKALINTSFNVRGKPIVHTTKDAIKQATAMGIDTVVLNGKLSLL